jgi:hypothetical protein
MQMKTKNLHRRLEVLEAGSITEPTMLRMADGSVATISGDGDHLLRLFETAVSGKSISPAEADHLELIRRSIGSRQPDGGHMVDLLRSFLLGPSTGSGCAELPRTE